MRVIVLSGATVPFHELVESINADVVAKLHEIGYTEVEVQYGHAQSSFQAIDGVKGFAFDPDLKNRIGEASLVITHAGAGSILDSLDRSDSKVSNRKILVVINQSLMGNHQLELASKLEKLGCVLVVHNPKFLLRELAMLPTKQFVPFAPPVGIQSLVNEELEKSDLMN